MELHGRSYGARCRILHSRPVSSLLLVSGDTWKATLKLRVSLSVTAPPGPVQDVSCVMRLPSMGQEGTDYNYERLLAQPPGGSIQPSLRNISEGGMPSC